MINKPLVSVVTPCYNAGSYILETIQSVINQEYENWEMIIVDDCSTDNSAEVIIQAIKNEPRIRYVTLGTNTGSPATPRNIGIDLSNGKYIALLDADDTWEPTKLQTQVMFMEKNGYCISYTNGTMADCNMVPIRPIIKESRVDYNGLLKAFELSSSAVMFLKDIISDSRFITKMPKEDFVFWLKVLRERKITAYNTGTYEYYYRILPTSRSRDKKQIIANHWYILRQIERMSFVRAVYYFCCWAKRSIIKYY